MNVTILSDLAVSANAHGEGAFSTCAYPSVTLAGDGAAVCSYRGGSEKHSYDSVLLSQKSCDNGATWSQPAVVFDGLALSPPQAAATGGVCRAADGSLLAFFAAVEATRPEHYIHSEEGRTQRRIIYTAASRDSGLTWSSPQTVNHAPHVQVGVTSKPHVFPNGEVFLTMESKNVSGRQSTIAAFSSDNGKTVGAFSELGMVDPDGEREMGDARFTIIDASVLALIWTWQSDSEETLEVRRSVSSAWRRTWSPPRPAGFVGQVSAPLSLGDGVVIAASNDRVPPEGIRLWLSTDEGETWQHPPTQMWDLRSSRIIGAPLAAQGGGTYEEGVWNALPQFTFGTPDLVFLLDGSVLMVYYATLDGCTHVRACRFLVTS